jgi:beta-mannosidase
MHAAPVFDTLRRVIPEDQRYHHSPSLDWHNKDNPKNKGDMLMQTITGVPSDLAEYIDFSQIAQAEGLKFGIEHFRRRTPHCSGALVWQLNDCWPVLSWSVLDYYGFGKASYFYLKRVFSPVLASFRAAEGGAIELWITNDRREPLDDTLTLRLGTFDGTSVWEQRLVVHVEAQTSRRVDAWGLDGSVPSADRYLGVRSGRGQFPANRHFFMPIKDLVRTLTGPEMSVTQAGPHHLQVELAAPADGYVFFAHLFVSQEATRSSDNFLDLEPGERRVIEVTNDLVALSPELVTLGWR